MGGDEFLIVAPNMTAGSVKAKAALLNEVARRAGREVCGKDILSISLGVAFYPRDGADAEQLLNEADRRMYVAKQTHYESARFGTLKTSGAASFNLYEEPARRGFTN
jgi:diguanylate cyclase (GGDEF)-like protein